MSAKPLGQVAYEAYVAEGQSAGRSSISHVELPSWDQQQPELQQRWEASAQAVRTAVLDAMQEP